MAEPRRRAAVLGHPVTHSLSPLLHRAAYEALGLDWTYEAIETDVDALPAVLAERPDWAGFSCTMPLKRAALEIATVVAPAAAAIGAANTLLPRPGGGWTAENTDVTGVVAAVRERITRTPTSATVLGAGGTAQAVVAALAVLGLRECHVLVRDRGRAVELLRTADALGVSVELGDLAVDAAPLGADLVVSTMPAGAADAFAAVAWQPHQSVFDVVYEPWPTALAAGAADRGATVLSGAVLLLHQAAAQVELMTGRLAPVEAMRAALRTARGEV